MSLTIPALTGRAVLPGIAVAFTSISAVTIAAPATAATTVPLRAIFRTCDFTAVRSSGAAESFGSVTAVVQSTGGSVSASVHISEPGTAGAHFDVALIQAPRASTLPCTAPGPGVAVGGLDLDGAGQGSATVQTGRKSGTTGVWLFVQRPSPYSQSPAEYYTSDFIVPV